MNKIIFIIIAVIIVAAGWLLISRKQEKPSLPKAPPSQELRRVPNFSLKDYNGKIISLADFKNKPMLINSWASWCPFCAKELEDFVFVQKEFGDKIAIIAVNRAEPLSKAKNFTDNLKTSGDLIFLLDFSDSFYQSIGGFSMPETIFVDKNGFIQEHKRGPMNLDEIRAKINNLLNI